MHGEDGLQIISWRKISGERGVIICLFFKIRHFQLMKRLSIDMYVEEIIYHILFLTLASARAIKRYIYASCVARETEATSAMRYF